MLNRWSLIIIGAISLIFFTNADQVIDQRQGLVNKLERIDQKLANQNLSGGASYLWTSLRHQVTQRLLFLDNAHNCHDAKRIDPNILEGVYEFRDPEVPLQYNAYKCTLGNTVTQVAAYPANQSHCTDGNCGFSGIATAQMVCGSKDNDQDKLCYAPLPIAVEVVDQLSSSSCEKDVTFGKNFFGIWTKKGCKARFEVKVLGNGGFVNAVNLDPLFGEDPEDHPFCPKKIPQLSLLRTSQCSGDSLRAKKITAARVSISENSKIYGELRKYSQDMDQLKADEKRLSQQVWTQAQKLVHLYRYRSCSELFRDQQELNFLTSTSNGATPFDQKAMTGQYYFYSAESKPEDRTVRNTPTFCDGSLLVKKDSTNSTEGWFYEPGQSTSKLFGSGINNATIRPGHAKNNYVYSDGSTNYLQKTSIFTPPLSVATVRLHDNGDDQTVIKTGYFVPVQCIAKKDVVYKPNSPYSYVDADDFGDVVYEAVGIRFCFKSGETFKYDKGHLLHGYRYKRFGLKGREHSIKEESMSQFNVVPLGKEPPKYFKLSGILSTSTAPTHCISKGKAEKNKERNDRPVLLKDDLRGIRARVYTWDNKSYCYGLNEEKAFNEDGLVYAYISKEGAGEIRKIAATVEMNPEALAPEIKVGLAEPIVTEESFELRGWACQVGRNESIKINIMAGSTIVKTLIAKDTSEGAVANACQSDGVNHRFKVVFDRSEISEYGGRDLNIEGISIDTQSTIDSSKSGLHKWPSDPTASNNCDGLGLLQKLRCKLGN